MEKVGGARDDESGVIIGLKDVYDAQMRNNDLLITLDAAVRAADASSRREWLGIRSILSDHETRIRRVERLQYAAPVTAVALVAAALVKAFA